MCINLNFCGEFKLYYSVWLEMEIVPSSLYMQLSFRDNSSSWLHESIPSSLVIQLRSNDAQVKLSSLSKPDNFPMNWPSKFNTVTCKIFNKLFKVFAVDNTCIIYHYLVMEPLIIKNEIANYVKPLAKPQFPKKYIHFYM